MTYAKENPVPLAGGHGAMNFGIRELQHNTGIPPWLQRVLAAYPVERGPMLSIGDLVRPLVIRFATATAINSHDPAARRSARRFLAEARD
jgi:hypothetical protein